MTEPMSEEQLDRLEKEPWWDDNDAADAIREIRRLRAEVERLKENTKYDLAWINKSKAKLAAHKDVILKAHIAMGDCLFKKAFFILDKGLEEK